jgi:hypothetical protein
MADHVTRRGLWCVGNEIAHVLLVSIPTSVIVSRAPGTTSLA